MSADDSNVYWASKERQWAQRERERQVGPSEGIIAEIVPFRERMIDRIQLTIDHNVDVSSQAREIIEDFSHQKLPEHAWSDLIGRLGSVAENTSDDRALSRLARLLVALSQAPDARNDTGDVIETDMNRRPRRQIAPGEIITCEQGGYLSSLPGLPDAMSITTPLQIMRNPRWRTLELARKAWTNYNAFLAHLCRVSYEQEAVCIELSGGWMERIGLETIRNGLEQPSGTDAAQDNACAAAKWLSILGTHIVTNSNWQNAGPFWQRGDWDVYEVGYSLWKSHIKSRLPLVDRMEFWKQHLLDISDDASFDGETRTTAWVVSEHLASHG